LRIFYIDYIINGKRDLDAVAIVVAPEDDPLETLHPLLCARGAVSSEVVGPVASHDGEVNAFLFLVGDVGRDAIAKINLPMGEV
jgi:hypothetical protein